MAVESIRPHRGPQMKSCAPTSTAVGTVRAGSSPADGEDLADAGSSGQQQVDDVGEIAGVMRP